MFKNIDYKKILPHILIIIGFIVLLGIYFKPVLENKKLKQHDIVMAKATQEEIRNHYEGTGDFPLWTNAIFGGMPVFQLWIIYPKNIATYFVQFIKLKLGEPIGSVFIYFVCFYILMLVLGVSPYLAGIGAFAFAFTSYNFINIEAGHSTKALAVGIAPLVLAGIILALKGKYLAGMLLTAIALSMEIRVNHLQITYYLFLMVLIFFIVEFIYVVKKKNYLPFFKSIGVLFISLILAIGVNLTALWTTNEYMKYSMRGGSELPAKDVEAVGLEKSYALSWSYGVKESFTLLIPHFAGGASVESLGTKSKLAEAGMSKANLKAIPTYWGALPSTSGPIYIGAIIIFLFVMGMFLVKHRYKWWLFATAALALMLSWGSNFMALTDLFYYHFPLYNKFRAPMTLLLIVGLAIPVLATLAIREFACGKTDKDEVLKALKYSFFSLGGITLFFAVFGSSMFDFVARIDETLESNNWPIDILRADRARMFQADSFRSFAFIFLAASAIFLFLKNKIKPNLLLILLAAFIMIDMWGVNKRYFNDDDFHRKSRNKYEYVQPTEADYYIMQDTDPHFRVLDLANNTFNDATRATFFKLIGGYHGAKMARYQDMIENHFVPEIRRVIHSLQNTGTINPEGIQALNMMNAKYLIVGESAAMVVPNPGRFGNAWVVENLLWVNNPREEIDTINKFDLRRVAVIERRFEEQLKDFRFNYDSLAEISLTKYEPDRLYYNSRATHDQLAVFSEVYYDKGWNVYVDGVLHPHFRVNYILRAMILPAGEHEIVFKFEPKTHANAEVISASFSLILLLLIMYAIYYYWNESRKKKSAKIS